VPDERGFRDGCMGCTGLRSQGAPADRRCPALPGLAVAHPEALAKWPAEPRVAMDPVLITALLFGSMFLCLAIGVPIAIALGGLTVGMIYGFWSPNALS